MAVQHINLFQPHYPLPRGLDVIFCRNVMIYFDVAVAGELVERLTEQLAPGGYLFVGPFGEPDRPPARPRAVWPSVYMRPE